VRFTWKGMVEGMGLEPIYRLSLVEECEESYRTILRRSPDSKLSCFCLSGIGGQRNLNMICARYCGISVGLYDPGLVTAFRVLLRRRERYPTGMLRR
jgi:hypothetical protein